MTQQVPGISGGRFESSPAQSREARREETDIGQTVASTQSAAATAARTSAMTQSDVRAGEAAAEQAEINLEEARRRLQAQQRRAPFAQAITSDTVRTLLANFSEARSLLEGGMATGAQGAVIGDFPGSPWARMWGINGQGGLRNAITAQGVMDALAASREGSAAGATPFGQLAIAEMELVRSLLGNLSSSNNKEGNLRALREMENAVRRMYAYDMGIDPRTRAGAEYVGISYNPDIDPEVNPRGASQRDAELLGAEVGPFVYRLPPGEEGDETEALTTGGGGVERGEWVSNPALRGVDRAVAGLITAGVAQDLPDAEIEASVRAYIDGIQPGLGAQVQYLQPNIEAARQGRNPQVTIEREYRPAETSLMGDVAEAVTPYFAGAADVVSRGYIDELTGKGAEMAALEEESPFGFGLGRFSGDVLNTLAGARLAGAMGTKVPWFLQGGIDNALYGSGSADPESRIAGAAIGAGLTIPSNIIGQGATSAITGLVRGATDPLSRLANEYGLRMTPGNVTPGGAMEWLENYMPGTGALVNRRRNESVVSANEGMFNTALQPIGANTRGTVGPFDAAGRRDFTPDPNAEALLGREGLSAGNRQVEDMYDAALDGVTVQINPADVFDDAFLKGINTPVAARARRELAQMRKNLVDANGFVSGRNIQTINQNLRDVGQALRDDTGIGESVTNGLAANRNNLLSAFEAQAPDNFQAFRAADSAYLNMGTAARALERGQAMPSGMTEVVEDRLTTPQRLSGAADTQARMFGNPRTAVEGGSPMQQYADVASARVQPSREGSMRQAIYGGLGVGVPAASFAGSYALSGNNTGGDPQNPQSAGQGGPFVPPWQAVAGAAGLGMLALPFTRGGSNAYQRLMMADRPALAQNLADLADKYARPVAGRTLGRMSTDALASGSGPQPIFIGEPESYADMYGATSVPALQAPAPQALTAGGSSIQYDPATDEFVDLETGERAKEVSGLSTYARGGRVTRKRPVPTRALKG